MSKFSIFVITCLGLMGCGPQEELADLKADLPSITPGLLSQYYFLGIEFRVNAPGGGVCKIPNIHSLPVPHDVRVGPVNSCPDHKMESFRVEPLNGTQFRVRSLRRHNLVMAVDTCHPHEIVPAKLVTHVADDSVFSLKPSSAYDVAENFVLYSRRDCDGNGSQETVRFAKVEHGKLHFRRITSKVHDINPYVLRGAYYTSTGNNPANAVIRISMDRFNDTPTINHFHYEGASICDQPGNTVWGMQALRHRHENGDWDWWRTKLKCTNHDGAWAAGDPGRGIHSDITTQCDFGQPAQGFRVERFRGGGDTDSYKFHALCGGHFRAPFGNFRGVGGHHEGTKDLICPPEKKVIGWDSYRLRHGNGDRDMHLFGIRCKGDYQTGSEPVASGGWGGKTSCSHKSIANRICSAAHGKYCSSHGTQLGCMDTPPNLKTGSVYENQGGNSQSCQPGYVMEAACNSHNGGCNGHNTWSRCRQINPHKYTTGHCHTVYGDSGQMLFPKGFDYALTSFCSSPNGGLTCGGHEQSATFCKIQGKHGFGLNSLGLSGHPAPREPGVIIKKWMDTWLPLVR